MMQWGIQHLQTGEINKCSEAQATHFMETSRNVIGTQYKIVVETGNKLLNRMLTEGLLKGDLSNLVLPKISIDEYVSSDPASDNIVIAFFLKGVPEAVLPFKNFIQKSRGVINTDSGDSDTIINTSIIYVEYDRENFDIGWINELLVYISMLASIAPDDFTMTFPNTTRNIPFDSEKLNQYFINRTIRKNRKEQQMAIDKAQQDLDAEIAQQQQMSADHEEQEQKQSQEQERGQKNSSQHDDLEQGLDQALSNPKDNIGKSPMEMIKPNESVINNIVNAFLV